MVACGSQSIWIGEVEAPDEAAAIEKAAEQFNVPATKLMVTRAIRYCARFHV
jgi:hypothetical protein